MQYQSPSIIWIPEDIDWRILANQLNNSKLFRGFNFTPERVMQLCNNDASGLQIESVWNDHVLIEEWKKDSRDIFMIINGQAQIIAQWKVIATMDKPADLFWENGYLDPKHGRIATVKTFHENPCMRHKILRIKSDFIETYLAKDPENRCRFYKNLGLEMTKKLQQMNTLLLNIWKHKECKPRLDAILDFFRREINIKKSSKAKKNLPDWVKIINPYDRLFHNCQLFEGIGEIPGFQCSIGKDVVETFMLGTIEWNIPEPIRPKFVQLDINESVFPLESNEFWVVLSGEVEIENLWEDGNPGLINRLGLDDIVWEVKALNLEIQRTAIVRARKRSTIVVLFSPAYINALTNIDLIALIYKNLLGSIGEKIKSMNQIWSMILEVSFQEQDCSDVREEICHTVQSLL